MISIVIPLYNKELTIASTLEAILKQSFKEFEIIIVNDGSTDESLRIVQGVEDTRLRLINQKNQGVSAARNRGVMEARYDWIAFLDADDLWKDDYLREMVLAMEEYPGKNIFSNGYSIVYKTQESRYTNVTLPNDGEIGVVDYIDAISVGQGPMNSSNSLIRKSLLIDSGMFKIGHKRYEDHDVWLRLYEEDGVVFINKKLLLINRSIPNRASSSVFEPQDLIKYLETIGLTKRKVSADRALKFERFYNKWCQRILLRFGKYYNMDEKRRIIKQMTLFLSTGKILEIKMICFFNLSVPFSYLNNLRKDIFKLHR